MVICSPLRVERVEHPLNVSVQHSNPLDFRQLLGVFGPVLNVLNASGEFAPPRKRSTVQHGIQKRPKSPVPPAFFDVERARSTVEHVERGIGPCGMLETVEHLLSGG